MSSFLFRWMLAAIAVVGLAACDSPGVSLVRPQDRIINVKEIDQSFPEIPLRIAVYLPPETLRSQAYGDFRKQARGNFVTYGPLGPSIAEAINDYFPKAFNEVYLVSDFPNAQMPATDIDAVIVLESVNVARFTIEERGLDEYWAFDSVMIFGIYAADGRLLKAVKVATTTPLPRTGWSDTVPMQNTIRIAALSRTAVRPTIRQFLLTFPRQETNDILANAAGSSPTDPKSIDDRRAALRARVAELSPKFPADAVDAIEDARAYASNMASLAAFGLAMNSAVAPFSASPSLTAANAALLNAALQQNAGSAGGASPSGVQFMMQFIGGVSQAAAARAGASNRRASSAQPVGSNSSSGGMANSAECQRLMQNYQACQARQGNMSSLGNTGAGTAGQAGSFADCQSLDLNAYNAMCR